jgi:hypothetical protein
MEDVDTRFSGFNTSRLLKFSSETKRQLPEFNSGQGQEFYFHHQSGRCAKGPSSLTRPEGTSTGPRDRTVDVHANMELTVNAVLFPFPLYASTMWCLGTVINL